MKNRIDGMEIEERVELINELKHYSPSSQYQTEVNMVLNEPQNIESLSSTKIKGILFEIFSINGDDDARVNIN